MKNESEGNSFENVIVEYACFPKTHNARNRRSSKIEKREMRWHRRKKTQKTKDEGRGFLYTSCGPAAHAFLPLCSIQAHTASAGQAGFASHKPLRFRPSGLQTPPALASPKGPCAAPPQAPSVAARRRRYNTLDLASKIVCQMGRCPLWKPLPRNPGFTGCFQPAGSFPSGLPM